MDQLWHNFWVLVWIPPILWAIVLIIDVFQTNNIFQDRWDGAIISSLFLTLPGLFFYSFFPFTLPPTVELMFLLTSGICGSMAMFFYFSALRHNDDVVIAESINNITIVLVPFFGFIFFSAHYNLYGILTIALAFASAMLFTFEYPYTPLGYKIRKNADQYFWKAFFIMLISMLFLTLSTVFADRGYQSANFSSGFSLYSLGHLIGGLCIWIACPKIIESEDLDTKSELRIGIIELITHHWRVFIMAELTATTAIIFFQRAIDLGDAAVATIIDATAPFLVLLFSFVVVSSKTFPESVLREISQKQLRNPLIKILASIGMFCSLIFTVLYLKL